MARKIKSVVIGAVLALAGVLAGMLSAQGALGQVGLPITTVTLPTVSVPLPPTPPPPPTPPTPPTPPAPPTPPTPPVPPVTTPAPPVGVPTPVSAAALPGSDPATGSVSPGSRSGSSTGESVGKPRRPASSSSKARVTGIRARSRRVTRGKRKRAARITFTLSAPGRVVFVVRGPAPSCGVIGRFSVQGRRGTNLVRFKGRVGRRNLPYGTYRITAKTRGRAASRPIVVFVGDRAGARNFSCGSSGTAPFGTYASLLGTFSSSSSGASGSGTAGAPGDKGSRAETAPTGQDRKAKEKPDSGVLPAVTDRLRKIPEALPRPHMPSASTSPPWIIGASALILLVLSGLALVFYVVRFLRRPHTT
ncbi:MAG: hypothetical protein M3P42_06585 [Actinomycetota bacterium]|nr:hypothetical protein [Actinomycetota bacterium]